MDHCVECKQEPVWDDPEEMETEPQDGPGASWVPVFQSTVVGSTDSARKESEDRVTVNGDIAIKQERDQTVEEETAAEDCSQSNVTLRYTVDNIVKLKKTSVSAPVTIRNLPWKIKVMPAKTSYSSERTVKTLGFFLQCNAESLSDTWSCRASAELRLINQKGGPHLIKQISHLFYISDSDCGFSDFIEQSELLDPEKGYIKDDSIVLEVCVMADAPHGVGLDCEQFTGYVGLKNQGAASYVKCLLQCLFFTNQLRKAVYLMPTESDDFAESIPLGLQRVFYDLQDSGEAVSTKRLPTLFSSEALDSFMQHELCRVFLHIIELKMKTTCVEGTIPMLFEGRLQSYVTCKHIDYKSVRIKPFYDFQINVTGKKNVYESFIDYITAQTMDGENKYNAGQYGLQEAERGIIFHSFPPVLHLQLLRFQDDPETDSNVEISDRYEFPCKLNLDPFLKEPEPTPADYTLHSVIVHKDDIHEGHYICYIDPTADGKWCKFEEDVISRCTELEAIRDNYGGHEDGLRGRHSTSVSMLVYIRDSCKADLLQPVTDDDIPTTLKRRLLEEKRREAQKRKERKEAHLYMTLRVVSEDQLYGYQGNDLCDFNKMKFSEFRILKMSTYDDVMTILSQAMGYPEEQMRIWPFISRTNQTYRPTWLNRDDPNKVVHDIADGSDIWTVFLETQLAEYPKISLPSFDQQYDVLLFLKLYDPKLKRISFCGHIYTPVNRKVGKLLPVLCERAGFPQDTPLTLYEEVRPNLAEKITDFTVALVEAIEELMDGDIIVFEKDDPKNAQYELPTVKDYFRDLFNHVDVTFYDKNNPIDPGLTLALSPKVNYIQIAEAVAAKLDTDPTLLQFFKSQGDGPSHPLRCTYDGTLQDLLSKFKPKQSKKLHYQKITALESLPLATLQCTGQSGHACALHSAACLLYYSNKT